MIGLYSPPLTLLAWAAWVAAFGNSDAATVVGLCAVAAAVVVHIRSRHRARI